MKTVKKVVDGKTEYLRVRDGFVKDSLKDGYVFCGKVEYKTVNSGYGKKSKKVEVKKEEDLTDGIVKKRRVEK